jgi:hypothetical protein
MDGQNKKNPSDVITKTHGLRLIKGGVSTPTAHQTSSAHGGLSANPSANTYRNTRVNPLINPLIKQLSALADAIDQDVAQIMKL